ncbi:MAG: dienelactone hydrolase family protein [Actinobacteria bacterium]|nr:dienelactone hydrolase family protein [Actinomycetota bacterium]
MSLGGRFRHPPAAGRDADEHPVRITLSDGPALDGELGVPSPAVATVVFAHGSGSSRHSPRNRMVAEHLRSRGLATLLLDLLTAEEEAVDLRTRELRFDIALLSTRVAVAARWAAGAPDVGGRPVGLFGASTGAAAALVAAARLPDVVGAVVSRGGRPDLADDALAAVRAPTLLLVGGLDDVVIGLNREAHNRMDAERRLDVIPGATHLFEEPGTLEAVARRAGDWFLTHLAPPARKERTP